MTGRSHTRFIVASIVLLSLVSLLCGSFLLLSGYQSGELLVQIGSCGLSGLVGFLGGKVMETTRPAVQNPDAVQTVTTETKRPE